MRSKCSQANSKPSANQSYVEVEDKFDSSDPDDPEEMHMITSEKDYVHKTPLLS